MNKHACKAGVTCITHAKYTKCTPISGHKPDWRDPLTGRALYNNIKTDPLRNKVGTVVGPSMQGM